MATLRETRAARVLTVRALAEQAGVAPSTVHLIETGKSIPRFEVIRKISAVLDIDPLEVEEFRVAIERAAEGESSSAARTHPMP